MPYITTEVDIDVDLEMFDTEDLVEELETRGVTPTLEVKELLEELHQAYILKQTIQVDLLLRDLFYKGIGRIV